MSELSLYDDSAFLRQLLDEVRDLAVYRLSADGYVDSWSRGAERVLGYTAEEVVGRHFSLFFTEEDRLADRPSALLREAIEQGRAEDEGWRVNADAGLVWTNGIFTPLRDSGGNVIGFVKVTRDLTDRRRRELELAREQASRAAAEASVAGLRFLVAASEALASSLDYEAILDTIAGMAVPEFADWCTIDLVEGNVLHRVATAHADTAHLGLAREYGKRYPPDPASPNGSWKVIRSGEAEFYPEITDEMLAHNVRDADQLAFLREMGLRSALCVPLLGRSQVVGALTFVQGQSGRTLTEYEFWIARQLGRHAGLAIESAILHRELEYQHTQLSETAIELEHQTEELQTQAIHLEELMTELEASNEELQARTTEAETANRAKADFLATMSHELRTPLNAIFGYADLLDLEIHGPVTPEQRHSLDRIKRNQRSLLALINDVLNFAKVEAGKLELEISRISVRHILTELEGVVGPQIAAKGLHYRFEKLASDLWVLGEPERVEQILLNLVTNAIKFTDPGGSIQISAADEGEVIRMRVRDSGLGIPPERLESVFDPFVQLHRASADTEVKGVGLGLAISRNLAIAMGGELTASSIVAEGSEFVLSLPKAR
jgi:PAS domain S-box-containing protein